MKQIFKKSLAVITALSFILSFMTGVPFSKLNFVIKSSAEISGDYEYTLLDNGTAEIAGFTGSAAELTIPSELDGYKVTSIGDRAFLYCTNLTSVIIPDSVITLGSRAFNNCSSVTSVTIPDSVTSIGEYAFSECDSLTSVTIPDSVTSISQFAFSYCDNLTTVKLSDNITSVGYSVFNTCSSLKSIEIPDGVTSIINGAFYSCESLECVIIPESVTSIGRSFDNCDNLTIYGYTGSYAEEYATENDIPFIAITDSDDSVDFEYEILSDGTAEITAYKGSAAELTIPSELDGYMVTSIGDRAFYGCESLTDVVIPDSVISIGEGVFYKCSSLTSVLIPDGVTSISDNLFCNCFNLTDITIPDNVVSIGDYAFATCSNLKNITIPDSVTSIGDYAFYGCYEFTYIEIPDSVTSIGSYAFRTCANLKTVIIPDSITSISDYLFAECYGLTSITIPESVTSIGNGSFEKCDDLTIYGYTGSYAEEYATENDIPFININESDESVEFEYEIISDGTAEITAYKGSAAELVIPSELDGYKVTLIGKSAFYGCESLTDVVIPDSVIYIDEYAFYGCDSLTSITIPDSVACICEFAIANCDSLTSIVIPDSVEWIQDHAFRDNKSLTSVTIPDSITSISNYLFCNCVNLTSITIPDSVTWIGEYAFYNCGKLTGITIPDSVTSIGNYAFDNCDITIYGYAGSYAEEYASENDIPFVYVTDSGAGDGGDTGEGGGDTDEEPEIPEHDCAVGEKYSYDYDEHWFTCSTCGKKLEETAKEHNYPDDYDYDASGHWKKCSVCGYKDESAHSFGEYTVKVEATETETGLKTATCKYCKYEIEVIIPTTSDTIYVNEGETYTADYLDSGKNFVVNGGKLTLGKYNIKSLTVNGGEAYGGTGEIGSVIINGGTFTSNGKINGDVLVTGGSGGLFNDTIGGTFYASNETEIGGSLTVEKYSVFKINGTVKVNKNFTFITKYKQPETYLNGTLWIGGNFTQENQPFNIYKVVFYTSASKIVSIDNYDDVVIKNIWITEEADNGTNLNQVFYFKNAPGGIHQCDNKGSDVTVSRNSYLIDYAETIGWQESLASNLDKLYDSYGSVTDTNFFGINGLEIEEKYKTDIMAQVAAWYAIIGSDYAAQTREYSKGCAIVFKDVPAEQNGVPRKLKITFGFVDFLKAIKESPYIPVKPVTDGITLKGLNYQIEVNGTSQIYKGTYNLTASTNQTEFAKGVLRTIDDGIKSDIEALFKSTGISQYVIKKMTANCFVDAIMEVYDGYKTVQGEVNKYKKFAGMVTPIYITKYKMKVDCPVDTYVYDENSVLIASIVNNEVVLDNENVFIWVEGESKNIGFNENGYTVKIVGNDTGTMDYSISIRDDLYNVMQTAEYCDLPVTLNYEYVYETGDVNKSDLVDANGNIIIPDEFSAGEKADTNGHTLTHIPYKAPAIMENGNIEHWYCKDCNMNFLDAVGYSEAGNVIIPLLSPAVTAPSYIEPIKTTSLPITTTANKPTEIVETDIGGEDSESDTDDTKIDKNTDTTKPSENENADTTKPVEDVDNDDNISSENDDKSDADDVVSEEDDANPETGVVICFGSTIISAMTVMLAKKRKKK